MKRFLRTSVAAAGLSFWALGGLQGCQKSVPCTCSCDNTGACLDCNGFPVNQDCSFLDCTKYVDQTSCPVSACAWNGKYCPPSAAYCALETTQADCPNVPGCQWVAKDNKCEQPPLTCPSYTDATSCTGAGCTYDSSTSTCHTSCGPYTDSTICDSVTGCTWNDTKKACFTSCDQYNGNCAACTDAAFGCTCGGSTCIPSPPGNQCNCAAGGTVTVTITPQCIVASATGMTTPCSSHTSSTDCATDSAHCTWSGTTVTGVDTDGDCIPDSLENTGFLGCPLYTGVTAETDCDKDLHCAWIGTCVGIEDPNNADTDGDGIRDGCEDANHNGVRDLSEMNPRYVDSDGDGIPDNVENPTLDGTFHAGQTSAIRPDTDGDGICDGPGNNDVTKGPTVARTALHGVQTLCSPTNCEDCNANGNVEGFDPNSVPVTKWGAHCYDPILSGAQPETDPRSRDSDNDGIPDSLEGIVPDLPPPSRPFPECISGACHDTVPPPENFTWAITVYTCDGGKTCAWNPDTDCDGLPDGKEDLNANGQVDFNETDPLNPDTDGDGILDGVEDANHNGHCDFPAETCPLLTDSDGDGIPDGVEDRNHNGIVDAWVDMNGDGCYTPGVDKQGESDPRKWDTDGDGIGDGIEDFNHDGCFGVKNADGTCDGGTNAAAMLVPDRTSPSYGDGSTAYPPQPLNKYTFTETAAWHSDTDCDGLPDGVEDANHNGFFDAGETDPRLPDTDRDGLYDGCPASLIGPPASKFCEDKNNNGKVDALETDPRNPDSDHDGLTDGCEVYFAKNSTVNPGGAYSPFPVTGGTDPLNPDSDDDGMNDGEEDANHNCQVDLGETDPRRADNTGGPTPPRLTCSAKYLTQITSVDSPRSTLDYRLVFEQEKDISNTPTPYQTLPFGKDMDANGFSPTTDPNDLLWGVAFQSPQLNLPEASLAHTIYKSPVYNRDIYGFLYVGDDYRLLDPILDALRTAMNGMTVPVAGTQTAVATVAQIGALTPRPAHDDLSPTFRIDHAQRQFSFSMSVATTAIQLRNALLTQIFTPGVPPDTNPPGAIAAGLDGVYGGVALAFTNFTVYVAAVERYDQLGVNGRPVVLTVVALTPDDRCSSYTDSATCQKQSCTWSGTTCNEGQYTPVLTRLYGERVTRLEDLTGGSAIARDAGSWDKLCDTLPATKAKADLIWVVDDSQSMQQHISSVYRAAQEAKNTLTANAGIVDFRTGMTTTNPSIVARTACYPGCGVNCLTLGTVPQATCDGSCADANLGCIQPTATGGSQQACPALCSASSSTSSCDAASCPASDFVASIPCAGPCTEQGTLAADINADAANWPLPGGGGTFYFEDSKYLDCKATSGTGNANQFIDSCCIAPYYAATTPVPFAFKLFCDAIAIRANAGFFGHADTTSCTLNKMDLLYDPNQTGPAACTSDPNRYCDRLISSCTDGPTNLASQMCDLMRAMGGLPCATGSGANAVTTQGKRRHSANEYGSRSARRLLQSLYPATPGDQATPNKLRLTCKSTDPNCKACAEPTCTLNTDCSSGSCQDGRCTCRAATDCNGAVTGQSCIAGQCACAVVPTLTIILSDEDDYWFKDECKVIGTGYNLSGSSQIDPNSTDQAPLPTQCQFTPWNTRPTPCMSNSDCPSNSACARGYCTVSCLNPTDSDPLAYCKGTLGYATGFVTRAAAGYNPDQTGWIDDHASASKFDDSFTVKRREDCSQFTHPGCLASALPPQNSGCLWDAGASTCYDPACTPLNGDETTSCVGDPCPQIQTQVLCTAYTAGHSIPAPVCVWTGNQCVSKCLTHTCSGLAQGACGDPCSWSNNRCTQSHSANANDLLQQKTNCLADPVGCYWNQGLVTGDLSGILTSDDQSAACQPLPLSDCQACKRAIHAHQAAAGGDGFPGLGTVGPVYAITRNAGAAGFIDPITKTQDACQGGSATWGRGDGQAYRDLADATFGRTQDVCAPTYQNFMELLITDIVALSRPYPLTGVPISATIKVGIGRPIDATHSIYINVPRSDVRGFVYNDTTNSIGFKSDPIDGDCTNAGCVGYNVCSTYTTLVDCSSPAAVIAGCQWSTTAGASGPTCNGQVACENAYCQWSYENSSCSDPAPSPPCGSCTLGGIETSEVCAATQSPYIPRPNVDPLLADTVYVSYRYWLPTACNDLCPTGDACVSALCPNSGSGTSCNPANNGSDCPIGQACTGAGNTCALACTSGQYVGTNCSGLSVAACAAAGCIWTGTVCTTAPACTQLTDSASCAAAGCSWSGAACEAPGVCIPTCQCPPCNTCDPGTGLCTPPASSCQCAPTNASCTPLTAQGKDNCQAAGCLWTGPASSGSCSAAPLCNPDSGAPNTCALGDACDPSTCTCQPSSTCVGAFNADGTVIAPTGCTDPNSCCASALQCCSNWASAAQSGACNGYSSQNNCTSGNCFWSTECAGIYTQAACTNAHCNWTPGTPGSCWLCQPMSTCCGASEIPSCSQDAETLSWSLMCSQPTCTCTHACTDCSIFSNLSDGGAACQFALGCIWNNTSSTCSGIAIKNCSGPTTPGGCAGIQDYASCINGDVCKWTCTSGSGPGCSGTCAALPAQTGPCYCINGAT